MGRQHLVSDRSLDALVPFVPNSVNRTACAGPVVGSLRSLDLGE
jgi:hypothetical protein